MTGATNCEMTTRHLTAEEFQATFGEAMRDVVHVTDVIDIWEYVAVIPKLELSGHTIDGQCVEHVYRTSDDVYDHVLVVTHTLNVYVVVVVDLKSNAIFGHRLLDLNEKYGLA